MPVQHLRIYAVRHERIYVFTESAPLVDILRLLLDLRSSRMSWMSSPRAVALNVEAGANYIVNTHTTDRFRALTSNNGIEDR